MKSVTLTIAELLSQATFYAGMYATTGKVMYLTLCEEIQAQLKELRTLNKEV